jgi:hypothetical protein
MELEDGGELQLRGNLRGIPEIGIEISWRRVSLRLEKHFERCEAALKCHRDRAEIETLKIFKNSSRSGFAETQSLTMLWLPDSSRVLVVETNRNKSVVVTYASDHDPSCRPRV